VGGTSGTNVTAPWTAVGEGTDGGTGGRWKTDNAAQLSFSVITDPSTGNVMIKRTTIFPPIHNGIVGSGGANSADDHELGLPVMKTMKSNDTAIPVYLPLPYTQANNGPTIANPSGTFICYGTLNFQ
jgi:hypothetical protein